MILDYAIFYAIKRALGINDNEVEYTYSPFCLNAKVDAKYSRCKQIVIYSDYKEIDIYFEKSVTDSSISELGKFGIVVVKPIIFPKKGELRVTPIVKEGEGICLHMSWH